MRSTTHLTAPLGSGSTSRTASGTRPRRVSRGGTIMVRTKVTWPLGIAGIALALSPALVAVAPKDSRQPLDQLVIVRPQLRVTQAPTNLDNPRVSAFRTEHGAS